MIYSAPKIVLNLIESYFSLRLGNSVVKTPYYINLKNKMNSGKHLRSLTGKGLPEEIVLETMIKARLRNVALTDLNTDEIRLFMQNEGIGVDCSGFVYHVLDAWSLFDNKRSIRKFLKYDNSVRTYISVILRPSCNTSADTMTNSANTSRVRLKDVRPGDLLRLKGISRGDHIAIVTAVEMTNGHVTWFEFAQSSQQFGDDNGVRISRVLVSDDERSLLEQGWQDFDTDGVDWTYKQLEKNYEDNGLRRLKFLDLSYESHD
jgi:hypothetical protein